LEHNPKSRLETLRVGCLPANRSVLSAKADEAEPLKPGKVWDEHSVLLLEGGEPLPDRLVSELQEEVKKVCRSAHLVVLVLCHMTSAQHCVANFGRFALHACWASGITT